MRSLRQYPPCIAHSVVTWHTVLVPFRSRDRYLTFRTASHVWSVEMYIDPVSRLFVPDSRFLWLSSRGYTSTAKQIKKKKQSEIEKEMNKYFFLISVNVGRWVGGWLNGRALSEHILNNMSLVTELEGRTHNTWLEVIARATYLPIRPNLTQPKGNLSFHCYWS